MNRITVRSLIVSAVASVAISLLGAAAIQAQPVVLNFDINGTSNTTPGAVGVATYVGLGAYTADTGTYWNPIDLTNNTTGASAGTVYDSAGNLDSGVSIAITTPFGGSSSGTASANVFNVQALLNDWIQAGSALNGDAGTFTFSGLPANIAYTLYLYSINGGAGNNGSTGFAIGANQATAANTSPSDDSSFISNDNYVTFTGNTGAGGNISGNFYATGSSGFGYFDGAQLLLGTTSTIPEPATLAILAAGALGLLAGRRLGAPGHR